jgi:hypothetical protein
MRLIPVVAGASKPTESVRATPRRASAVREEDSESPAALEAAEALGDSRALEAAAQSASDDADADPAVNVAADLTTASVPERATATARGGVVEDGASPGTGFGYDDEITPAAAAAVAAAAAAVSPAAAAESVPDADVTEEDYDDAFDDDADEVVTARPPATAAPRAAAPDANAVVRGYFSDARAWMAVTTLPAPAGTRTIDRGSALPSADADDVLRSLAAGGVVPAGACYAGKGSLDRGARTVWMLVVQVSTAP